MHGSFPFDDNMMGPGADPDSIPDNGWAVQLNNTGTSTQLFAAYAVCGSATTVDEQYVVVSPGAVGTEKIAGGVRILVMPDSRTEPRS